MFDSVPSRCSYVSERCCYIIIIPAFLPIPFTNIRHYICPFIAVHSQVTGYTMTVGVRPSPSDCTQYPCVQVYNHSVVTIRPTLYTVLLLPLSLHYNQLGPLDIIGRYTSHQSSSFYVVTNPQYMKPPRSSSLFGLFMHLVNTSAKLDLVFSFASLHTLAATFSRQKWYAILCCFLFNVDSGVEAFL